MALNLPDAMVLLQGSSPEEALASLEPAEQAQLAAFPSEKRRQDWLFGRFAAKRAVHALVGAWPAIATGPAGEPRVILPGEPGLAVSLSHGHGRALAWARRTGPGGGLPGVDLELVRPRPEGTFRFYLHPDEREPVLALAPGPRDRLAILLWALKEAAFKALVPPRGLGLLDVHLAVPSGWDAPQGSCQVAFREGLAERARELGGGEVCAEWRYEGDLVLAWVLVLGARLP